MFCFDVYPRGIALLCARAISLFRQFFGTYYLTPIGEGITFHSESTTGMPPLDATALRG
jgi:hypothetical protein